MKVLTFNIQAGIGTGALRDYVFKAHHQLMDTRKKRKTLGAIAKFIADFDIVCLQEVDLGGRRSGFSSQVDDLQKISGFEYAAAQTNRIVGQASKHGNAILSKFPIEEVKDNKLPSRIPGRGKLLCKISGLTIINTHLSLRDAVQAQQLAYIDNFIDGRTPVLMCGDLNCRAHAPYLENFADNNDLNIVTGPHTLSYPSWKPKRDLDHILVSQSLGPMKVEAIDTKLSDHRPVSVEFTLKD